MSWCCDNDDFQLLPIEWLNRIWRPDSYFKNAKQVTFQTMTIPNHYVWLYRTKKIFYMVKYVSIPGQRRVINATSAGSRKFHNHKKGPSRIRAV